MATHAGRVIGGVEAYLGMLVPALRDAGHDVALWYDTTGPRDRPPIDTDSVARHWDAEALGEGAALRGLREWRPDVIFSHGVASPATDDLLLGIAPAVLFAHAYYGACVSGTKSRLAPTRAPCPRPLGWPCLLHYLPRRCGGLNPATMLQLYHLETRRKRSLSRYRGIVTASPHMQAEYRRYDVMPENVHAVDLPVGSGSALPTRTGAHALGDGALAPSVSPLEHEWRLLFIGRITELKGLKLLIDALPHIRKAYSGMIQLTVVGDGAERPDAERHARHVTAPLGDVQVKFAGWLDVAGRAARLGSADLLVVPSVWPEPFGLVGPEAGLLGVPAAAFAVGGIPTWLEEGVSGHLADGRRPDARSLAQAIVRCLEDPAHHARLRDGASITARRFTMDRHLAQLIPILEHAATG